MKTLTKTLLAVCGIIAISPQIQAQKMTYDKPATCFEEALVIGNGTMGAAVYGGQNMERISLNDITLWTGEPCSDKIYTPDAWKNIEKVRSLLDKEDYAAANEANKAIQGEFTQNYQPLGNLFLNESVDEKAASDTKYTRTLDLPTATATVKYGNIERKYFASAPDSVIVLRIAASNGAKINERISFNSLLPTRLTVKDLQDNAAELTVKGYAGYASSPDYTGTDYKSDINRGIHFTTMVRAIAKGGTVKGLYNQCLEAVDCDELLILITNVTSFDGMYSNPAKNGRNHEQMAANRINAASQKDFGTLHSSHVRDFGQYFNRVSIDLGTTASEIASLPTDHQLKLYTEQHQSNPDLEELYFQFGRYLLISCSRTQGVPANLQGLWNEHLLPPWSCNYTTNINLQENYWPAEVANLSEMHMPMLDFVQRLPKSGAVSAKNYYNVDKGWCLGHNTDIWGLTNPVGRRWGDPCWANWNMGGAWVSTHIWEHYQFTMDKQFLAKAYPTLKGAADFCLGWMIEKDGKLMTSPCTSPENHYLIPESGFWGATHYGGFSDIAMIKECLLDTRMAAAELGIDKAYCDTLTKAINKLLPYRIGARGNLQEFYHDWEGRDPQHRHQSHLFGLYPGHHITTAKTPELAKACAKTLDIKGPMSTGWSTGWRVNLQARLHDGEKAYLTYQKLLTYVAPTDNHGGTYPNLLDAHSPFQIDGNFGGCAGVMEMLMQSEYEPGKPASIELLPALPKAWKASGRISGLKARGGYEVSMAWKDGKITELSITSHRAAKSTVTVKCGGKNWKAAIEGGARKVIL
ncbi:MAG: glycoside hydrolase family 95 protein [Bacteroidales bacterium]|nr:glycoside hydrolase family 95 protein [Bacteroidales bacterium]